MAEATAPRWMRLMGAQGRPTARPPGGVELAATVSRYPERAAQALADQSRRQGQAASAREARGWIREQLDAAADLLDTDVRERISELAEPLITARFPEDASTNG